MASDHRVTEDGSVSLRSVTKRFGDSLAVDGVDLEINPGEFVSLLGPSGCGKTTTLRMMSGFEQPTSGSVHISGSDMTNVPPNKRNVNTVFQSYALFEHLTVAENIAFGLRVKRFNKHEISKRVRDALELVQLGQLAARHPAQLSGGQQQRVALARAIVNDPDVLLLDEPLSALDLKLRQAMRFELGRIHSDLGMTFVFVTHDQDEAITMSDRIAVMNAGRIHQLGTPHEIYERPASRFVADFIGETNLLEVTVVGGDAELTIVALGSGHQIRCAPVGGENLQTDSSVAVAVRPQRVVVGAIGELDVASHALVPGFLTELLFLGDSTRAVVTLADNSKLIALRHNQVGAHPFGDLRPGDAVEAGWRHGSACLVDR